MNSQNNPNEKDRFKSRFHFINDEKRAAMIRIVGVGGGGGNAVNTMIDNGLEGVDLIVVNTDKQDLQRNRAEIKIHAGEEGRGAGARPEKGRECVDKAANHIEDVLSESDMVFITAGMGGGTGTGGAPVIAKIAREMGILTVAIVTRPFAFEGIHRARAAEDGITELRKYVDTIVIIDNNRLIDETTSFLDSFKRADMVLYNATKGISDLITQYGMINLDFNDVKTTMQNGGLTLIGTAEASGDNRAEKAARAVLTDPLFEGVSIQGSRNILVNITAGKSFRINEPDIAVSVIKEAAGPEVEVIFGVVIDEQMGDNIRVTLIATGFEQNASATAQTVVKQEVEEEVEAVAEATATQPEAVTIFVRPVQTTPPPAAPESTSQPTPNRVTLQRTRPIDGKAPHDYRGEDNLRHYDPPAYERRAFNDGKDSVADRMRKIQHDERNKRRDDDDDSGTPAFLKNIMD